MNKFPTIGEYNQALQKNGSSIFSTLSSVEIIPSRTLPIKVFLFGSGAFAAVFKGNLNNKLYALRFFLEASSENMSRYEKICSYLQQIDSTWKVNCEFLQNEITVKNIKLPVLKMDWIQGKLINEFVSHNLHNKAVLANLQKEIVNVANDLNNNKIGHGDIQCGNMIIVGSSTSFQLKLIDYDGMFTPNQNTSKSIENGRSEFNHPERNKMHFGTYIDRFPFWVMLCALEALNFDPSLWKEVMQGGFNTLDNFLFVRNDFVNPNTSKLIERLKGLRIDSVDFYLEKILAFSKNSIYATELPIIFSNSRSTKTQIKFHNDNSRFKNQSNIQSEFKEIFIIKCNKPGIQILSSNLEKIGSLPLELDKYKYSNKIVIATDGNQLKRIHLTPQKTTIFIEWVELHKEEKSFEHKTKNPSSASPKTEAKSEKNYSFTSPSKSNTSGQTKKSNNQSQTNTQKGKSKSKSNAGIAVIIIAILIIVPVIWFAVPEMSSNTKVNHTQQEDDKSENHFSPEKKIRNFIKAEDAHDFSGIISMLSPEIYKYWDLKYPNHQDIRDRYYQTWSKTKDSKNHILSIEEFDINEYNLKTNYTYLNLNNNNYYETTSVIRFEFDDEGQILATYIIEGDTPQTIPNPNKELSEEELTTELQNKIITFFDAESNIDIENIKLLLSSEIIYFLGEYYPEYSEIEAIYNNKWKENFTRNITLIKIAQNDVRSFNIELLETRYNRTLEKEEKYNYIKRIDFNNKNKIERYQVEDIEKILSKNEDPQLDKRITKSVPTNYLYRTSLKYTPGPPIRKEASIDSKEIAEFPTNKLIYILERTNIGYYKIYVNGITGYMSKGYLTRQ